MDRLVSVIIPTYNVKKDIDKCLESIINQTYKNLEIIIVDDCSTDGTFEYISNKYKHYDFIKIFKNEKNLKAAYTRNKAIEHSNGEYIAIQDADDYSDLKRIEKQVEFLEKNNYYDFVGTNAYSYDEKGIWKKTNHIDTPTIEQVISGSFPFVHGSMMFRKEAMISVKCYKVSKDTERGQDADLIMRLLKDGKKAYNLNESLYYYQENLDTVKKRNFSKRISVTRNKLKHTPWKTMSLKSKIIVIRTLLIGLIPARIWYFIMKKRAKKTLKS